MTRFRGPLVVLIALIVVAPCLTPGAWSVAAQVEDCGPLERGQIAHGEVVAGSVDRCREAEVWTFRGVEGQAVEITMERSWPLTFASITLDPFLQLYAPSAGPEGRPAVQNDDSGYSLGARIRTVLRETGTYRVVASGIAATVGEYRLWLSIVGLSATDRGEIRPGQTVTGRIEAANPEESWWFEGRAGQRVLISMAKSRPFALDSFFLDPLVFLFRPELDGVTTIVEAVNDDAFDEFDAVLMLELEHTGRYRILATRAGESFGQYELTLQIEDAGR